MCWGGVYFTFFCFGLLFFFLGTITLNEFSFADTDMNNSGAALRIKNLSPVSNSVPTETCLVGCLN